MSLISTISITSVMTCITFTEIMYKLWIQLWRIEWFKAIVLSINKSKYEYSMT